MIQVIACLLRQDHWSQRRPVTPHAPWQVFRHRAEHQRVWRPVVPPTGCESEAGGFHLRELACLPSQGTTQKRRGCRIRCLVDFSRVREEPTLRVWGRRARGPQRQGGESTGRVQPQNKAGAAESTRKIVTDDIGHPRDVVVRLERSTDPGG